MTSRQTARDLLDVEAIEALDWLVAPRTGLEYLDAVESGRRWNDYVRSCAGPQEKTKTRQKKDQLTLQSIRLQ